MTRRLANIPGITFALVFAWKIALLGFTAQPVPLGDAFFYDGAVVNHLNGGGYFNPSVALVLPINGSEVFSAYPPLYQGVLWTWMRVFGAGALAAMWLQAVLVGITLLAVLALLRRLRTPAPAINLAGLFAFGITFHDRPDTLAMACGVWAIYAWLRADLDQQGQWRWLGVALSVLALCTSLQIGVLFLAWVGLMHLLLHWPRWPGLPWRPLAATVLIPLGLVALVKFGCPRWWEGFREHVRETPSLVGWATEGAAADFKGNLLKFLRTCPALPVVYVGFAWVWARRAPPASQWLQAPRNVTLLCGLLGAGALVGCSLGLLMPNVLSWTSYLQPLFVGLFLAWLSELNRGALNRLCRAGFVALALVVAVRAIGMSTWGVLCARDVSQASANQRVRASLADCAPGATVILSAPFLYEAAAHRQIRALHADWLIPFGRGHSLAARLAELKPARLILTQFDYWRRYQFEIAHLQSRASQLKVRVSNSARLRPPDSYPLIQRVVQNISWAPVVVDCTWPAGDPSPDGAARTVELNHELPESHEKE